MRIPYCSPLHPVLAVGDVVIVAETLEQQFEGVDVDLQGLALDPILADEDGRDGAVDLGYDGHDIGEYGEPLLEAHVLERTLVIEDVSGVYLDLVVSGVGEVLLFETTDSAVDILPCALVDGQCGEDILRLRIRAFRFPRFVDIRQIHPTPLYSEGLYSIYRSPKGNHTIASVVLPKASRLYTPFRR